MKITSGKNLKLQQTAVYQYLASFSGFLLIICSGMHYGWPSPSLPMLLKENSTNLVTVSNDEGSWMAVMPLIGGILGSISAAIFVDIIGRKPLIILSSFPYLVSWIMIAYAKSSFILNAARFIAGISDGWAFTSIPMFIGEIADPKIRGFLGAGVSVMWIFGMLLINVIGSYLSISTTALVSSILPILGLITFIWMPESPYFLIMRSNEKGAKRSLRKFRGVEDIDHEYNRVLEGVKEESKAKGTGSVLDLLKVRSNRKAIGIMMILRAAQQMSGTSAIIFYTKPILQEAGDNLSVELETIIYYCVQFIMTFICSSIVDRTGRRPLLLISISGSALFLFIIGTYFYLESCTEINLSNVSYIPLIGLIGFNIIFSIGMQSIPILMLGELFSPNIKAFALCWADIYFCVIATTVSKFFQVMKDNFGMHVPFYVFFVNCLIGFVAIYKYVPETKGKTLEDIQRYFKRSSDRKSVV